MARGETSPWNDEIFRNDLPDTLGVLCCRFGERNLPDAFGCTELSREKNWLFLSGTPGIPQWRCKILINVFLSR